MQQTIIYILNTEQHTCMLFYSSIQIDACTDSVYHVGSLSAQEREPEDEATAEHVYFQFWFWQHVLSK